MLKVAFDRSETRVVERLVGEIKDVGNGNMFQVCATRTRCTLRRSSGRALSSTVT